MTEFQLPLAPAGQSGAVKAWQEPVVIPSYLPEAPDKNPMFLEKRVYQGSSGRVYPLPFTSRISTEKVAHTWQAAHLENEFVRVMILPEIGGRIHVGLDKASGYDFFYRQNVIKPALVGLAGPWASGGVEFNWPQHHRPATFMPVDIEIESHADGSQTIWCQDRDPMTRLQGMHGVCLHPGKSYVELKVRLYNCTPFVQTFLWWANAAVRVHEEYQSFFPPDVHYVADHARRAMSSYPLCTGTYYGVDYAARAPHNDLTWYRNIPVPTSYMAMGSSEDFMGGYDHRAQAGLVHVANHHISPGKKQWTWGNHPFGYAWDRNLTDSDGPYVELMAGVYTDNQPDFSFLAPYETKTFSQYWYPIQKIGPVQFASLDAAISLQVADGVARVGVCVTSPLPGATVRLDPVASWTRDLAPGVGFRAEAEVGAEPLTVIVSTPTREVARYVPRIEEPAGEAPPPATEPPLPEEIATADELYLTGLHLDQYRHATRHPEIYWQEALRRDPADSRCNNAMGLWHLRRGEFIEAEQRFRRAIATLTRLNANPYDGEPHYNLGLTLRFLDRLDDAYAAFYKSAWCAAWRSPAYYAIAEIDTQRGDFSKALYHLNEALRVNTDHLHARCLCVMVLRRLGQEAEAANFLEKTLALNPLDPWASYLAGRPIPGGNQSRLDLAFDCARAGLEAEADEILAGADFTATDGSAPMVLYALGRWEEAAAASPDYCFPSRLEEMIVLEAAIRTNPSDARARYYLGNLLYDRRRHREAIEHWEWSVKLDWNFSISWRNLGIAHFNVRRDAEAARDCFDRALRANPYDARLLYERDQLWKRTGIDPGRRLAEFEAALPLVEERDDLCVELAALYNQTRQPEKAAALLESRRFQPWEGGEGLALQQHERAHILLGRRALAAGDSETARAHFERALECPENLGEARHPLAVPYDIYYWLGEAGAEGDWYEQAARGDTYYSALALRRLNRHAEAAEVCGVLLAASERIHSQPPRVDYFATSLPAMLLFDDDPARAAEIQAAFLEAQGRLGLGQTEAARFLLRRVLELDSSHAGAADLPD